MILFSSRVLHSHNHIKLYTYTCRNIVNTLMTSEQTFLEEYTSHTLFEMVAKGLCVRGELETEQTATYWSPVPLSLAALLSRSARLLDRGSGGPIALCWVLVLSTASYLQLTDSKLTEPVCRTGLYNCLTSTCFLWALHMPPIQPVHSQSYTLISSTGCTCFSIDGWVEGQYVQEFFQIVCLVIFFNAWLNFTHSSDICLTVKPFCM